MKVIFDMASVIQTGLRKGDCGEAYEVLNPETGKVDKVNPWTHGYENAVDYMVAKLDTLKCHPADAILVFEGKDSKKRRMQIMPTYKGQRGKSTKEYYTEYNRCKDEVEKAFYAVGAMSVEQDFAEGDDTIKYFVDLLDEEVHVVSNDVDLSVLAGVNAKGHKVTVWAGVDENKLPEGVYEPRHITLYKATVGDTSDSVKGVPGFGQKAWDELLMKYGGDGIDEITALVRNNDVNSLSQFAKANNCKLLNKLVDAWNDLRMCFRAVTIYSEWVNTRYHALKWRPGIVLAPGQDERLHKYAQVRYLVTSENYEQAYSRLVNAVQRYPDLPVALDVETWTPEETDEWLAAQGNPDGVDPLSAHLAGFSLTFGPGGRFTYYVSVDHAFTANVSMSQARKMIEAVHSTLKPIHNTSYELTVLYNDFAKDEDGTLWRDHWKDAGEFGFLPNIEDTLFMSSYVDENAMQRNLKALSRNVLKYKQTEFNEMRTFGCSSEPAIVWEGDTPLYKHEHIARPFEGGELFFKKVEEPVMENGVQARTSKGKLKFAAKTMEVQGRKDGEPWTVRKRNPATGIMENMPKMVKVVLTEPCVRYKMNELPATSVFDYGTDDTICTMAYWRFAKMHMLADDHYHVYREVEIDAGYLHAKNFYDGFPIAIHELMQQKKHDEQTLASAQEVLFSYLIENGWKGTLQPTYGADITPAQIKEAYSIVYNLEESDEDDEDDEAEEKDPVMSTRVRMPSKIIDLILAQERPGVEIFAGHLKNLLGGSPDGFNKYVGSHFDGKPRFSANSKKDMPHLLYNVMGLTVKVRNKPTPKMKAAGIREGSPKGDALAIAYGIAEMTKAGKERELAVLKALQLIVMVNTREGLFYRPYPHFVHWHDARVHSSHRQCHANTRRASSAAPNMQQMPVHAKIKGQESAFRRVVQPHKKRALVVSLDFNAQELRSIADDSQDPNMLACYVGDRKKDMHSITGANIAVKKVSAEMSPIMDALAEEYPQREDRIYYAFRAMEENHPKIYGEYRSLGKKVNFTTEYGAMAPKLAATLMVEEDEAQEFIDAREEAFKVAAEWKAVKLVAFAKEQGFVRTRKGAKRHLAEMLDSNDRMISSKAERQAVNFRIQGSCAEQTKLAEGRMWRAGLFTGKYDAVCYGPVHDEVVSSVLVDDLVEFIQEKHALMVQKYADMEVPVVSSIAFGPNFYDQVEIGEEPTREAILKGLEKVKELYPEYEL